MIAIFDYEHLNAILFVEPTAIVEPVPDRLPGTTLERSRLLKPQSNAVAPPGVA